MTVAAKREDLHDSMVALSGASEALNRLFVPYRELEAVKEHPDHARAVLSAIGGVQNAMAALMVIINAMSETQHEPA